MPPCDHGGTPLHPLFLWTLPAADVMHKHWLTAVFIALGFACPLAEARDLLCEFRGSGAALAFGALDPSLATTVTVPVTLGTLTVGDCTPGGQTMTIAADNGLNFGNGSRRLFNGADSFIPYSINGLPLTLPRPGNNTYVTFSFSGTVQGTAYENARVGLHQDTVILSVTP